MTVSATGTRAREPDERGYASAADGLRLYWEVHGGGSTTIVLLPPNPISHSRLWKAQIHYLARHYRVVAYDGRGNGNSDSPDPEGSWLDAWWASDCLAVMDATATEKAILAGICGDGVWPSIQLAAAHPERVLGIVALAPGVPLLTPPHPWRAAAIETFEQVFDDPQGWEKYNRDYMRRDYAGFLEFFFGEMFPEPHSTKQVEDAVAFGLDGPVEALLMDTVQPIASTREEVEEVCRGVRCPVLVIQGDRDNCQTFERGQALAELIGAQHVRVADGGHLPNARHPVLVNGLIHEFAGRVAPRRASLRTAARARRALMVCSPIGLGHVWRDVAIADELRKLHPDLEIHWLAQHPVTTVLEARGESILPASAELAPEAAHVDAEAGEHELNAFQMLRRLDEIFCANFMVFHDLVEADRFDVWIADEAWEVDYFLHENPGLKTAPYVWLTDFVGILPMPEGGEREAFLAADYNAQMVEHVAGNPELRDRAIFIGDPEDIVAERLGPDLPAIGAWTRQHFQFAGYVSGFDTAEIADRDGLRAEFGYRHDEKICIVAAGGSAAGIHLLERAAAAFPEAKRRIPELRMILVTGPRIDPRSLPAGDGLEARGYVHRLHRHLAACDIAIRSSNRISVVVGGFEASGDGSRLARSCSAFPRAGSHPREAPLSARLFERTEGRRRSGCRATPSPCHERLRPTTRPEDDSRPPTAALIRLELLSHGGLSTTMELTAGARPFLYFPLRRHFEQSHHVSHRLRRYGAGRRMDFATDGPAEIAAALAEDIDREPRHGHIDPRGATRAAEAIGELL